MPALPPSSDLAPLEGTTLRVSADSLAARVASRLLADFGARIEQVSPETPADLAGLDGAVTEGGLRLSHFGPSGPYRDAPATAQAVMAIGGALAGQYSYRPGAVYLVAPYCEAAQGIMGAIALLGRRLCADAESCEVPDHVSALQGQFAIQAGSYVFGEAQDAERWNHTPRGQWPSYATYQTSDGEWLFVGASTTVFMIKLFQALGLDDILSDTHDGPRSMRDPVGTGIWKRIADIFATDTREAWLARISEFGVPAGPVLTLEDAVQNAQVRHLGLVDDELELHNLVRVAKQSEGPRPAPSKGPLPLSGLRVLEVTGYIAGSYTGRLLADLGADVVKVEAPGGDPFRNTGYGFSSWNYGKRGLALDLSTPEGNDQVVRMARVADIFVTNYRAESLKRLGLDRATLFEANSTLIHCALSAFGADGPLTHLPGFDPVVQGFVGVMRRQGGDDEPVKSQMAATDYMSAMLATLGVMAARTRQQEVGGGFAVSTSLLAAAMSLLFDAVEALHDGREYQRGGRDFTGPDALEGIHQASDGWLLVTAQGAKPKAATAAARAYLRAEVAGDSVAVALRRMEQLGIDALPCIHPNDLPHRKDLEPSNLWTRIEQPGLGTLVLPHPILRSTPLTRHAPVLGEVPDLSDWLDSDAGGHRLRRRRRVNRSDLRDATTARGT